MIIRTVAYPRAALVGNPSDGYHGKTIAFVFDNYRAEVQLYETPELEILASRRDYTHFGSLEDMHRDIEQFGYYGGIRLLKAAGKKFFEYCRSNGFDPGRKNFTIRYDSDIPNRLGLAGSSAIITAAMKAMFKFYGLTIEPAHLANLVLSTERDELGIPAGLQDRVAQAYNVPVFMDFDRDYMEQHKIGKYHEIEIPEELKLYVAYRTDLAEGSEILHSRLRDDYEAGVPAVLAAMQEWASLTEQVAEAIEKRDFSAVPALLDRNFDLRCEVCAGSVSPKNRRMVEIARTCGASAKFTGSGGAIIGTFEDDAMYEKMAEEFSKSGVALIKPRIVKSGDTNVNP
ncbi:MAG: GHMP kinase [Lentisphaeria bacterium]|nr:GHMP kinase [Lentisphaeria bacterium]